MDFKPEPCLSRFSVVDRKYIFQNSNVYAVYEDGSNIFTEHKGKEVLLTLTHKRLERS